jgi:hypothetical protein
VARIERINVEDKQRTLNFIVGILFLRATKMAKANINGRKA